MSIIQPINTPSGNSRAFTTVWGPMANGDSGLPIQFAQFTDKSVQAIGAFGAGGNVRLEGSNDGVNYVALHDPQGNVLDLNALKIEAVSEASLWVRPRVTSGDATTQITVALLLKE